MKVLVHDGVGIGTGPAVARACKALASSSRKKKPAMVDGLSNVSKGRLIANKSRSKHAHDTQ
ncbi:hypothetical protein O165_009990 [Pseudomonas soli]|nr:hypothetical protein O165_009990 [Pseudomonas soli]